MENILLRELSGKKQFRALYIDPVASRGAFDDTNRLVEFTLSSETPCERSYGYEILGHDKENINLARLLNKAPCCFEHQTENVIGVIESAEIVNRRLMVVVRFSENEFANNIYKDIKAKIRTKVSVGYFVDDIKQIEDDENGKKRFLVTSWTPFEGSVVGVAFDDQVGIGRGLEAKDQVFNLEVKSVKEAVVQSEEPKKEEKVFSEVRKMTITEEEIKKLQNSASESQKRAAEIAKIGKEFNMEKEALDFIQTDKPVDEFQNQILRSYKENPQKFVKNQQGSKELVLTDKEVKQFNLFRAIEGASKNNGVFQNSYEKEISDEFGKTCGRALQKEGSIWIPPQVQAQAMMKRSAQTAATNASAGYSTSAIMHPELYIDALNNATVVGQAGATVLRNLIGSSIVIPRKTARATGEWVAEDNAADRSAFTLDQVTLSPKTFSAFTSCSRLLRLESSLDIMNLIQNDLMQEIDIKIDSAAINGTGSNNQPTGIRYQSGINTVTTATDGSALTHALSLSARTAIYNDNVQGALTWLINANTEGAAMTVPRVSAQAIFLIENGLFEGMRYLLTNQCVSNLTKGSGTSLSSAILGYFPDLLLGYWGGLELVVNPYSMAPTGEIEVSVLQSVDVAVRHPESFCEFRDIIT